MGYEIAHNLRLVAFSTTRSQQHIFLQKNTYKSNKLNIELPEQKSKPRTSSITALINNTYSTELTAWM